MAFKKYKADPDSDLDYEVDWTNWLTTDLVATSVWSLLEGDITKIEFHSAVIFNGQRCVTWIRFIGAVEGDEFIVTNSITTNAATQRKEDASFKIVLTEK